MNNFITNTVSYFDATILFAVILLMILNIFVYFKLYKLMGFKSILVHSNREIIHFFNSINKSWKQDKTSDKQWILVKELLLFLLLVLWCCNIRQDDSLYPSFKLLMQRISKFIEKSSFSQTFHYLKEVLRITVKILGDQNPGRGKLLVKCDSSGLPTIIPLLLRKEIINRRSRYDNNREVIVAILSVLSVFRTFNVNTKVSLKTITSPFTGSCKTLSNLTINNALFNLFNHSSVVNKFNIKPNRLLLLETASPNCAKSTWGSSIEALAFANHPRVFINFCKLNWLLGFKNMWLTCWIILINIFGALYRVIFFIYRTFVFLLTMKELPKFEKLHIAKLGVVYDQAGKARIVGISNYWVQCLLKPIHDAIFDILRLIEEDGTFDQHGPLNKLIKSTTVGQMFYSFDLSAATDRLPVILQADILNILKPNLGSYWLSLLTDMNYSFLISKDRYRNVRYSVGQPMGAYSSWPMLALCHHIIVHSAAINAGLREFKQYAILGDDVVIANDMVAIEYIKIMEALGVTINMNKTLQSSTLCEFAKCWVGHDVDYTPIGAGLILQSIRYKEALATLVSKCVDMNLIKYNRILDYMRTIPYNWKIKPVQWNVLWVAFGLSNLYRYKSQVELSLLKQNITWCFSIPRSAIPATSFLITSSLLQVIRDKQISGFSQLERDTKHFIKNAFYINVVKSNWTRALQEALLKVLSPGLYVYIFQLYSEYKRLHSINLEWSDYSFDGVITLLKSEKSPISVNINWKSKDAVKEEFFIADLIFKAHQQQLIDLEMLIGMGDLPVGEISKQESSNNDLFFHSNNKGRITPLGPDEDFVNGPDCY